jgi:hypothetical protein
LIENIDYVVDVDIEKIFVYNLMLNFRHYVFSQMFDNFF